MSAREEPKGNGISAAGWRNEERMSHYAVVFWLPPSKFGHDLSCAFYPFDWKMSIGF
jgi:hypothetical protein